MQLINSIMADSQRLNPEYLSKGVAQPSKGRMESVCGRRYPALTHLSQSAGSLR